MHEVSILAWMAENLGTPASWASRYQHVAMSVFVAVMLVAASLLAWRRLRHVPERLIPEARVTLVNAFEVIVEAVLRAMEDLMGPQARRHVPLICTLFIYILVSDLIGVIPGFYPPTSNINTNLGCALVVFVYYNYVGIKDQGLKKYLAHMAGPVIWLAPLIFVIEVISQLVRPLSLSIRLMGNIAGDHVVLGIFSEIAPVFVPVIFMGLAIFISIMQAFVFTLLSIVYIYMASGRADH